MARQYPTAQRAICADCSNACETRQAKTSAHQHVDRTGHTVEIQRYWGVYSDAAVWAAKPAARRPQPQFRHAAGMNCSR
jgi:hypothetical protein